MLRSLARLSARRSIAACAIVVLPFVSQVNGARVYGVDIPGERKKTEADPIGLKKQAYREHAAPVFETFGPKTKREFEALAAEREGLPA